MSTAETQISTGTPAQEPQFWTAFEHERMLQCNVLLCPEVEGGYSAHCLNLPGVVSEGDDEAEAIANVSDAFREMVLYFRDAKKDIPWGDEIVEDAPAGSRQKWILVGI